MTGVLDRSGPFSTKLQIIRRLDSGQYKAGAEDGPGPSFGGRAQRCAAPAPSRDDVPLLDPSCSGLSAGAEAALGLRGRAKFINFHHVASDLRVPPGYRERRQTVSNPHSACADVSQDQAWNSRAISDAVLRARAAGEISEGNVYICATRDHSNNRRRVRQAQRVGAEMEKSVCWRGWGGQNCL